MSQHATASSALHLRADGISFSYPDRRVLTDVDLVVPAGRPTGLLGENGSGKSTLLRILAGVLDPSRGEVRAPGPVGLLHQDLPFPGSVAFAEVIDDALSRSRRIERELALAGEALAAAGEDPSSQLARRFDELLAEATLADVWNAASRAETVLARLRLDMVPAATPLAGISGGQRERLALAHLLIARPVTWLLDEPTNHLDDDGAAFLAASIAAHPGPVLIASHDRAFLDDATVAQIDLDPAESPLSRPAGGASVFTGGFSDYLMARFDARARWEQRFREEQEELKRLREVASDAHDLGRESSSRAEVRMARKFFGDRNATRISRHVREAERRLEALEREQVRKPPAELHFTHLPGASSRRSEVLLTVADAGVEGRLRPTSLTLSAGEKLLVTGVNGSGKSTLLNLVTGALDPTTGHVGRPRSLRIGHLGQDDEPVPGRSVRAHLLQAAAARPGAVPPEDPQREVPELFGLVHPRDLDRPLELLSRGQLRRAMLAALLLDPPELLVLDEPTNHLALVTATRFEQALTTWDGTVLIASHDRWLRERWHGEQLHLPA